MLIFLKVECLYCINLVLTKILKSAIVSYRINSSGKVYWEVSDIKDFEEKPSIYTDLWREKTHPMRSLESSSSFVDRLLITVLDPTDNKISLWFDSKLTSDSFYFFFFLKLLSRLFQFKLNYFKRNDSKSFFLNSVLYLYFETGTNIWIIMDGNYNAIYWIFNILFSFYNTLTNVILAKLGLLLRAIMCCTFISRKKSTYRKSGWKSLSDDLLWFVYDLYNVHASYWFKDNLTLFHNYFKGKTY